MKLSTFFLIIIIFSFHYSYTQKSVTGNITDDYENPLNGVNIKVKNTTSSTLSDKNGNYSISIPEGYNIIVFDKEGYLTQETEITSNIMNVIMTNEVVGMLDLTLEELMKIEIVTAGKKSEKINEIPASIVIITRKEIESYGYRNIMEILENIPGLFVNRGYYSEGIGVRGYYADENVIYLVNGVNQHERMPVVPVECIERIEVVRGPMSVLYGTGAFFGAINIITNEKPDEYKTNIIAASYGSLNSGKATGKFFTESSKSRIVINASMQHTDGIDVNYSDLINDPTRLPYLGVSENQTTNKQLERNTMFFNISTKFSDFYADITVTRDYRENLLFYPSIDDGSLCKKIYNYVTFGYKKNITDEFLIDAKIDYYQRIRDFKFNYNLDSLGVTFENAYYIEEYKESKFVSEIDLFWQPFHKLEITSGLYGRFEIEGTDRTDIPFWGNYLTNSDLYFVSPGTYANTFALFTQIKYMPAENLIFTAGARFEKMCGFDVFHEISQGTNYDTTFFDRYAGTEIQIVPRFAAIYTFDETSVLKLLYGQAIRNPRIKDIYSDKWAVETSGIQKEDLTSEKIQTIELSYISSLLNGKLVPSINLFRNQFQNMIIKHQIYNQENGNYYWLYDNVGEMVTNGIEFSLQAEPAKNLRSELSITTQKTIDMKKDSLADYDTIVVGNSPKLLAYAKISYQIKKLNVSFAVNYVDAMESAWDPKKSKRESKSVDSYLNSGLNIYFENIFFDGFFTSLRISNIFDSKIRYISGSDEFTQRGFIGEPRTYYFSVGYKF